MDNEERQPVSERLQLLREEAELTRLSVESTIEMVTARAKIAKATFDALLQSGFSESQAFDLIRTRGHDLTCPVFTFPKSQP